MTVTDQQKEHIQVTFEVYCKTILRNKARNLQDKMDRLEDRELSFSFLSDGTDRSDVHEDTYILDDPVPFEVHGQTIFVSDPQLARVLKSLLPKYRDILLLSFFTDYNNVEIAHILGIPKSTVQPRIEAALRRMRERMGELDEE